MALLPSLTATPGGTLEGGPPSIGAVTVASPLMGGSVITPTAIAGFTAGPATLSTLPATASLPTGTTPTTATPAALGTPATAVPPPTSTLATTTPATPPAPTATATTATATAAGGGTSAVPAAQPDSLALPAGMTSTIAASYLLSNDTAPVAGDPLHLVALSAAENATVALTARGNVAFTPDSGFIGTASFTYTAADQQFGQHGSAPVQINVVPLPLAPQTLIHPQSPPPAGLSAAAQQLVQIEAHLAAMDPPPADHPVVHEIPLLV